MNRGTETRALHWDVAQAAVVVVAALIFLPPLRGVLMWPAIGLGVVLAVLLGVALVKQKLATVSHNLTSFKSLPTAPTLAATTGTTEFVHKSLTEKINGLDWSPFEKLVIGLYMALGYVAKRSGGVQADGAVNLILQKDKSKTFAQCKQWKAAEVDEKELKEFAGTLSNERFQDGIFVTAREFSFGARRFAAMNNLILVGSKDLLRMMDEANWKNNQVLQGILDYSRKLCPRCEKEMALKTADSGPNPGSRVWVCTGAPKCGYTVNL